jgi:hypothetical protein
MELIVFEHRKEHRLHKKNQMMTKEEINKVLDLTPKPLLITNSVDENWGFLSTRKTLTMSKCIT